MKRIILPFIIVLALVGIGIGATYNFPPQEGTHTITGSMATSGSGTIEATSQKDTPSSNPIMKLNGVTQDIYIRLKESTSRIQFRTDPSLDTGLICELLVIFLS